MSNKLLIAQNGVKITETTVYPTNPSNGMIVYRTDLGGFYVYETGAWAKLQIQSTTLTLPELGVDPATPASGFRTLYAKAGGFYQKDSAGNVSKVGGGSGSSLNLFADPSFEDGVDGWAITALPTTGTALSVAADLLTPTNLKMLQLSFTGSSAAQDSVAQKTLVIPAAFFNKNCIMTGWYKTTTPFIDYLFDYGIGQDIFIRPQGDTGLWNYFEFPFKPTTTNLQFTVRNNSTGIGNFSVVFDEMSIGLSSDKQAQFQQFGTAAIDFNSAVTQLEIGANVSFTFANPRGGRVTSLIVKNVSGVTRTVSFPTSIKRADIPLTVLSGNTNVYTIIVTWNATTATNNYYVAAVSNMV